MRLKASKPFLALILVVFCVIQCEIAECYKSEVEITPSPLEEPTTKKSGGFFGGIKSFFRGTTTVDPLLEATTPKTLPQQPFKPASEPVPHANAAGAAHKPPPLHIAPAPLMPLGPRPDTPSSSPFGGGSPLQPPQWPQPGATTHGSTSTTTTGRPQQVPPQQSPQHVPQQIPQQVPKQSPQQFPQNAQHVPHGAAAPFGGTTQQRPNAGQPNLPPGFQSSYHPSKPQPSGLDLSYGSGGASAGRPQPAGRPGFGLAPLSVPTTSTTTTTTTTTTPKPAQVPDTMNVDLRGGFGGAQTSTTTLRPGQAKNDYPPLPPPRRPSTGAKEDFPALPVPKSPSPTPTSPLRPSSPSAWNTPISTPSSPVRPGAPAVPFPSAAGTSTPASPIRPAVPAPGSTPASSSGGNNRVSYVPHTGSTTTMRPGFQSSANSLATDDEIRTLTETLFNKEVNSQMSLIRVNVQGKTRSIDSTDEAPQPLLTIEEKALESPTIAKMRLLFNNYDADTLTNEHVTPNERKEENEFLDAVMATSVMRQAMLFLQNKGIVTADPKTHRDLVKELWFTQYSRGQGKIGSSGFEHVFVHEVKNGTLIGLHNWAYFYEEEKAGRLDYKGYLKELDLGTKGKIVKMRFTHNGINKPVNSLFIGTSPELELALYTVCFQLRPDSTCPVSLGNNKFGIVAYSWRYRGKNLIGSAFPEI